MFGYIGDTPITYYGCVLCQREHRKGIDAEYTPHIYHQSKHGIKIRGPLDKGEEFLAAMIADGPSKDDTVRCIDDTNGANFLIAGKCYTVESTQVDDNGKLRLNLVGMARAWEVERFEVIGK